jgi:hypothetical protein
LRPRTIFPTEQQTNNQLKNTMSIPNTAIAFPQTARDSIAAKLAESKALFPVLVPVSPDERKGLQSIAEGREPYVAEAFTDAQANPKTVPGTVDMAAWALLEEQYEGLDEMESLFDGVLGLIRGVKAVCGDARYDKARRYYKYLQDNLDALPGAEGISAKLEKLFAKQGNHAAKPATATAAPAK